MSEKAAAPWHEALQGHQRGADAVRKLDIRLVHDVHRDGVQSWALGCATSRTRSFVPSVLGLSAKVSMYMYIAVYRGVLTVV